jgi:hypothetical protein
LADPRQTTRATLFGDTDQTKRPAAEMGAIAGAWVFAGADGVRGLWAGLHGGALPLQTTPPKAGGPLETKFWGVFSTQCSLTRPRTKKLSREYRRCTVGRIP